MIDYLSNKNGINQLKPSLGNTIHYLSAINCQTFSIGSDFFNVSPLVNGYLKSNFLEINTFMKYFKNAKTKNSKNIHANSLINLILALSSSIKTNDIAIIINANPQETNLIALNSCLR